MQIRLTTQREHGIYTLTSHQRRYNVMFIQRQINGDATSRLYNVGLTSIFYDVYKTSN